MSLITKEGLERLKAEQEALKLEEQEAVQAVVVARGFGDFSENAELEAANSWVERVRKKLAENEERISSAEIFDSAVVNKEIVGFGATVEVEDEDEKVFSYKITSDFEANVQEGKVSVSSPIVRALSGKAVDDECIVNTPKGEKSLLVKKIEYK